MKEEGTPFRIVLLSKLETQNVMTMPNTITAVRIRVEFSEDRNPLCAVPATKNSEMMARSVGKATFCQRGISY